MSWPPRKTEQVELFSKLVGNLLTRKSYASEAALKADGQRAGAIAGAVLEAELDRRGMSKIPVGQKSITIQIPGKLVLEGLTLPARHEGEPDRRYWERIVTGDESSIPVC